MQAPPSTEAANELFHDDTYEIPIGNLALLIPKLERLNRKAARLGCEPVTYEILERITREVVVDDITGYRRTIEFAVVSVKGERPQLEGWTFVATLMHAGEAGTIIRAVPGFDVPEQYRNATAEWCDHCKQVRSRRDTYVVYNASVGFRQVGKQCLQDFLGGASPQTLAARFNWLLEARQAFLGATGWREQQVYYLDEFLAFTAEQIKRHGWISKKRAMESEDSQTPVQATAYEAMHMMLNWQTLRDRQKDYPLTEWWVPDDSSKTKAKTAQEAVLASLDKNVEAGIELNDYQHNVHVVLRSPAFEWRAAGIAASILPFYDRLVEEERQRENRKPSEYQGEIGKQIYRKVTVLRMHVRYVDQQDKDASIVGFVDDDGNEYVWFASRLVEEWHEGDELFVRATVKNHMTSRIGIKQTVMTYVKQVSPMEYEAATRPKPVVTPSNVVTFTRSQLPPSVQAMLPNTPATPRAAPATGSTDTYVTLYQSLDIYEELRNQPISRQARALKARGYSTATIAKMLQRSYQQVYQAVGK